VQGGSPEASHQTNLVPAGGISRPEPPSTRHSSGAFCPGCSRNSRTRLCMSAPRSRPGSAPFSQAAIQVQGQGGPGRAGQVRILVVASLHRCTAMSCSCNACNALHGRWPATLQRCNPPSDADSLPRGWTACPLRSPGPTVAILSDTPASHPLEPSPGPSARTVYPVLGSVLSSLRPSLSSPRPRRGRLPGEVVSDLPPRPCTRGPPARPRNRCP
jgi:hypothetical protein